ncbi:unnamed protein product [Paramecium octaurelia]|uniref:Uncharacterized protein n=1 Tax=Paramecium octaurelia TaxID=43137 RepID=A0A8S1SEL8_PAROT|nr:unnamed protein product [Paramecium octaurelia]
MCNMDMKILSYYYTKSILVKSFTKSQLLQPQRMLVIRRAIIYFQIASHYFQVLINDSKYQKQQHKSYQVASGSGDKSIRLWDVKTRQQNAELDGHSSTVYSICYSPDGTTIASGSEDSSIRQWDVNIGQQILSSNNRYKNILTKFSPPTFTNNLLLESVTVPITILLISQQLIFQTYKALLLKGEFINQSGDIIQTKRKFHFSKLN